MDMAVYEGQVVTVLAVRRSSGAEVTVFVCEDQEEITFYKRLFDGRAPHKLDHSTPLGRKLKKHYPGLVLEILKPPTEDGGWPWIVALYTPKPVPDGQRGHWTFEVAGDGEEADAIMCDIQQYAIRSTMRLKLDD